MLFLILLSLLSVSTSTLIVKPPPQDKDGLEAGLILIQGAQISAQYYNKYAQQLQSKFPGKLWIAIPDFPLSVPEPLQISQEIQASFDSLTKSGCKLNKNMPFFLGGHSLGGIIVQDYILNNDTINKLPVKFSGLILEGAYVERKNRDNSIKLDSNILTLGGELDGLNRITRMTESFYFNKKENNNKQITLLVKGMNHYQFAGEGEPPFLVKQNDIKAEISDDQARDQITSIVNSFMKISLGISNDDDTKLIQNQLNYTNQLVDPIIAAFQLEGYYHFDPPCYKAAQGVNCTKGSPWTRISQQVMGSLNLTVIGNDLFFPASQVFPDPLPEIHNNCYNPPMNNCTLNVSTVSEAVYANGESSDTALQPIAATEIKSKMMSRQSILKAATGNTYDFKDTDGNSLCADINRESIKTAISMSNIETANRYSKIGRILAVGSDMDLTNAGPIWIWSPLVKIFLI